MHEGLQLFDEVVQNPIFQNTPIFVFLNKKDLFEQMIREGKPLSRCFPDYRVRRSKQCNNTDDLDNGTIVIIMMRKFMINIIILMTTIGCLIAWSHELHVPGQGPVGVEIVREGKPFSCFFAGHRVR